jgi:hypothetical protein
MVVIFGSDYSGSVDLYQFVDIRGGMEIVTRATGEPGGIDVLVALRLLIDGSEGQVRHVLQEAIREIERLRAAVDDESAEKKPQRACASTLS